MQTMEIEIRDLARANVDHALLERAARIALNEGGGQVERLSVALVDDDRITEIARSFRGANGPTDVIAFEAEGELDQTGEVIISLQTAERQAKEAGHSLAREACLLMAHGVLHVLGYDDENETGALQMRAMQDRVLDLLGEI